MFKTTSVMLACGLLKLASAVQLTSGAEADCGSCCAIPMMMSCGCDCEEEIHVPEPPVEPIEGNIPEAVANIELNLDVLLTHILHEEHPDIPEMPEPNTPEEQELITEVIEPVVIQLINDDIVPSIPTCTLPGQQGSNPDPFEGPSNIDNAQVIAGVIEQALSGVELGQDITIDDIIDVSMPAQEIVDELDLETQEGEDMINSILDKVREITGQAEEEEEEEEVAEEVEEVEEEITEEVADEEADDEPVETDEATIEVADEVADEEDNI